MGTQRLLFSATLDNGIDVLVQRFLRDPVVHSVDPEVAPVSTMTHHVLAVRTDDKNAVVRRLAAGHDRTLLFTRTKHGAKKLAKVLTATGIPAVDLHGNLSQNARERNLEAFSTGSVRVLVATDIAARGIHVDDISLVVHVDPPAEHKAYLHRSGRTARAGAEGVVVTMMVPEQAGDVRALAKAAGIRPTITAVEADHPMLEQLAGPAAPLVTPAPEAPAVAARPRPQRGTGRAYTVFRYSPSGKVTGWSSACPVRSISSRSNPARDAAAWTARKKSAAPTRLEHDDCTSTPSRSTSATARVVSRS